MLGVGDVELRIKEKRSGVWRDAWKKMGSDYGI
jgi:hypothetical protein